MFRAMSGLRVIVQVGWCESGRLLGSSVWRVSKFESKSCSMTPGVDEVVVPVALHQMLNSVVTVKAGFWFGMQSRAKAHVEVVGSG